MPQYPQRAAGTPSAKRVELGGSFISRQFADQHGGDGRQTVEGEDLVEVAEGGGAEGGDSFGSQCGAGAESVFFVVNVVGGGRRDLGEWSCRLGMAHIMRRAVRPFFALPPGGTGGAAMSSCK